MLVDYITDQMFEKYKPQKAPLNPFQEVEEDLHETSETERDKTQPVQGNINNSSASTNPFGEEEEDLDDNNPFSDNFESSSLERPAKRAAPPPPRSKSQTLPPCKSNQVDQRAVSPKPCLEVEDKEKKHKYIKSPKKKAPVPPSRPVYEGTPPPSPKQSRSREKTPITESESNSSVASTPSST